jgi:L-cysteine S-thiosulfotransferase
MRSFLARAAWLAVIVFPAAAQQPPALELFLRNDKGGCASCHQLPEGAAPASRADVGPRLEGTRMRALGRAGLRDVLTDPMRANPATVMPPYGRHRLLEPAEIERLVEFLHALP